MEKTDVCRECPLFACDSMGGPDQIRPDILFIGGYPVEADIKGGPFTGKNSSLLRSVAENMKRRHPGGNRMRLAYGYAALCAPPWDETARKYQINADVFKRCAVHILEYIDVEKPKAVVCLGTDALHALGFKGTEGEYRGSLLSVSTKDGEKIPVVATFHIVKVAKDPGILPTFQKDLGKAFALATDGIDHTAMHLETPVEFADVMALLSRAREETAARYRETGRPVALAVDTETSSLESYNMKDRVIAVSLSWKAGQGAAFPFEHKAHPYSQEEFQQIREELSSLLSGPEVSLVMANGKFDTQWLAMHYQLPMNKVFYDTMLAEHILDEDKKGEYSLKALTKDRFPSMGRYEKE
ncbi:MAG: uracil-DNA glycosylase family protein, partial [Mailhella sp.]